MSEVPIALRTTLADLICRVASKDSNLDWTDDPTALDLAEQRVEDLVGAKHTMTQLRKALGQVSQFIDRLIAADVHQHGSIRLGESVFTASMTSCRRVLPGMGDRLIEFLGADLARCVNPNDVRITSARGVALERGMDADLMENTFYEHVIAAEPELRVLPVSQRKWALALEDGERLPPR